MINPIISICIPTYNRATNLKETLNSIVSQSRFQETEDVEIVILDNGSTDNTSKVIDDFEKKYYRKITRCYNENNDMFLDLEKLFSLGKGVFLKFNNDTLKHNNGSLDKMIQIICECQKDGTIPFFSTGVLKTEKNILCNTLDSFVGIVSYWSTWTGAFGIWKEDFQHFEDFSRHKRLQILQTDVLFRLINTNKAVLINCERLFITLPLEKKGGYDLITVFLDNYIFLLAEQVRNKALSEKTFSKERRKLLFRFICPWLINIKINPEKYYFTANNSFRRIFSHYKQDFLTLVIYIVYFNLALYFNLAKKSMSKYFSKQPSSLHTIFSYIL
jgi:glycosyltransferase involved in cell wall biosynthesis